MSIREGLAPWLSAPAAVLALAVILLVPGVSSAANEAAVRADTSSFRVDTTDGPVKGQVKSNVATFLGIPYAQPPVGELRWRPPVRPYFRSTVFSAKKFGPNCAQFSERIFAGPTNANEDCLYLNVFTPKTSNKSGKKLPVIVWIYGGGNADGESTDYDGSKLASDGNVVVVTFNYRMNLMGFLSHPSLDVEGHPFGNYGILDQQFAMRWVQRNIKKFGGDKDNVTVGGQSAGASDTVVHMISPLAKRLFHRAIVQSGVSYFSGLATVPRAQAKGVAFAEAAGCGSGTDAATAQCLRALPAEKIMSLAGTGKGNGPFITYLVQDGQIITESFTSAFKTGRFNHIPVMNGTVQDEANFALGIVQYFKDEQQRYEKADFDQTVKSTYSGNAGPGGAPPAYPEGTVDKVFAHYPVESYDTPQLALNAVTTDVSACRSLRASDLLAGKVPVYGYEFQDRTAPNYFPKLKGFQPLAYHTSDIQYLFKGFHGGPEGIEQKLNAKQKKLSDEMIASWAKFAKTGNPNENGNSPWPRYVGKGGKYLSQNIPDLTTFKRKSFVDGHQCDFWDKVLYYY